MSLLLLFLPSGAAPAAATRRTGGWLTPEQAAAQLREIKRREREESERRAKIRAKARELEEVIAEAYAKATGKPRLRKALEDVEAPAEFTPETIREIGQEIAEKLSQALEGTGRRYSQERAQLEQLERALEDFARLVEDRERKRKQLIAEMLLLAVV